MNDNVFMAMVYDTCLRARAHGVCVLGSNFSEACA